MPGLVVNCHVINLEEYEVHRTKASTLDLGDISVPKT